MKIEDWIDTNDLEHLRAIEHLNRTGTGPVDFLPDGIEINPMASIMILAKLGIEYIDLKIEALEQE